MKDEFWVKISQKALRVQGCSSMPSAIINYGGSSGASFGSARLNLQKASFGIVQAAALDKKYQSLSTAQGINY